MIEPNSEIALVSSSYDMGGHTIAIKTGVNDTFTVNADPTGFALAIDVTLNAGTYTLPALCTELLRATNASAAYSGTFTASVFPASARVVTEDHADAAKIKFEFAYEPQGGIPPAYSTTEGTNGYTSYVSGEVLGGINLEQGGAKRGLYYKNGTTDSYASGKVVSFSSNTLKGQAFGYSNVDASDGLEYFCLSFKPGDGGEMLIGITDNANLPADEAPIQFRIGEDGGFQAYQRAINGSIVRFDNPQNQVVDRSLIQRIIVPATVQSNGGLSNAVRFQSAALHTASVSAGTDYTVNEQVYDPTGRPHYIVASIKSPTLSGLIPVTANATGITGVVSKTNSALAPGDNYLVGEILVGTGGAGLGFRARVDSIDAAGRITDYTVTWAGENYTAGDVITLTGQGSFRTNAAITATTVTTACTIEDAGTNWQVGDTPGDIEGRGTEIEIAALSGTGEVTAVHITDEGTGYTGGNLTYTNPRAGNDLVLKFPFFVSNFATMNELKHNALVTGAGALPQLDRNNRNRITFGAGLADTLNLSTTPFNNAGDDLIIESATDMTSDSRLNNQMIVNLDNFPLKSIHKGGNGQAVAVVPIGGSTNQDTGLFYQESFNLLYHKLHNREVINANEAHVRITDVNGSPLVGLLHPVTVNLDLRPATR